MDGLPSAESDEGPGEANGGGKEQWDRRKRKRGREREREGPTGELEGTATRGTEETTRGHEEGRTIERPDQP